MNLSKKVTDLSVRIGNYIRDEIKPHLLPTIGNIGQIATVTQQGTVAFIDPFLINGGTINGNVNTIGVVSTTGFKLSNKTFANYDGTFFRIKNPYNVDALSIGNTQNYYDATDGHFFRGYGGASSLTLITNAGNTQLYSYSAKHLFGVQADNGTAVQFAGAISAKSNLTVLGDAILGGASFANNHVSAKLNVLGDAWFGDYNAQSTINIEGYLKFRILDNVVGGIRVNNVDSNNGGITLQRSVGGVLSDGLNLNYLGYVGIGTNNPFSKLHLFGNGQLNGINLGDRGDNPNTVSSSIFTQDSGNGILTVNIGKCNVGTGTIDLNPNGGLVKLASSRLIVDATTNTITSASSKHLFGVQTDDGTANQFAGNVVIKGALNSNTGININGYGGLVNAANKFGIDFYKENGNTRFYSHGGNTTTAGGYEFHGNSSNGLIDTIRLFISNNGNVGIGTTTPVTLLDVRGTILSSGSFGDNSVDSAYRLKFYDNGGVANDSGIGLDGSGGGSEQMWFNSLDGFKWYTGTNGEKMRITSTGNVGIGTTNPSTRLTINSNPSNNNSADTKISVYADGASSYGIGFSKYTNYGLGLFSGGSHSSAPKVFIEDSGNVGIGTTNPIAKLTLGKSPASLKLKSWDNSDLTGFDFYEAVDFPTTSVYGRILDINAGSGNSGGSNIRFLTADANLAGTTRLLISSSGNVGIGTVTPNSKLHLYSTAGNSIVCITDSTIGQNYGGYVKGYGVTGSGGKLDLGVIDNNTYSAAITIDEQAHFIRFRTNLSGTLSEKMIIDTYGNVGIGTTSPLAKTHIIGSGFSDVLRFSASAIGTHDWTINPFIVGVSNGGLSFNNNITNNTPFVISSTGDVGIGTKSPSGIIDVVSTTKPSYPLPRMTTTQVNAITGMSAGAFVFDTTTNHPKYYNGNTWVSI